MGTNDSPVAGEVAAGWRVVAQATAEGFAWDVRRLRFLLGDVEVRGELSSSGDAGESYRIENTANDHPGFWGGRADHAGRLHVSVTTPSATLAIDRIDIDQSGEHWASSIVIERRDEDGSWRTWRRFDGLQAERVQLRVHADGDASRVPALSSDVLALSSQPVAAPSFDFGEFDDRRVLVLIASYRDSELAETIASAIAQAAFPEHLRFAICHQYGDETADLLEPWVGDPRFSVDPVPYVESQGCGWARRRTFALYDDEPYILQIDAHTRFAARWDSRYIDMLEQIDAELPILTTYPPRYTLAGDGEVILDLTAGVQQLYVAEVTPGLSTVQRTRPLQDLSRPAPSPTLAAGQIFTRGRFCRDVDYDPEIYFGGEEISLAARAYTSGYDLFCPNETLIWHLYDHDQPKHWDDHDSYRAANDRTTERLRTLFQGDAGSLGSCGLGTERSLAQFERHAGISLGAGPVDSVVHIDRSAIEPRDDYAKFVIVLLGDDGNEVERREVRAPNVLDLSCDIVRLGEIARSARSYIVITITHAGEVGTVAVRPLEPDARRDGGRRSPLA